MNITLNWLKTGSFLLLLALSCQSCVKHRELVSLNANESVPEGMRDKKEVSNTVLYKFQPYQIQPYDQLMIKINAFDGSTEGFLNREFAEENTSGSNIDYSPESVFFNSYTVDEKGRVALPMVGEVEVKGMTSIQVKEMLDEKYTPYLKFASTSVKLSNMRLTVLGEVNNPGVYYLYNEQTTLMDAISMAGDITDFGNRKKVKVIRQRNGQARSVYLNLNRSDFLATEFYYMQPSDVIYIEPIKAKSLQVSSNTVGVVISAISLGAVLVSLFLN